MSTFGGLMVEYPQISIDRFQGDAVLKARGYFLSHCHSDHMVGLSSKKFADRLKCNPHIKLYCSEVTFEFLLTDERYKHLQASLFSLPIEQTSTVTLVNEFNGQEEKLLVTLLPAGHCPGSVMFLFEGSEGTVLYTGDFRLAKGEAARMDPLHSGSRVKDISSVYLDTTFCVPEAMFIPSREESKDALLDLVDRQISKSAGHMVKLNCKAKYGYEYLFVELSKTFNQKVHVSDTLMKQYDRVPDLCTHLTTEGSLTQIHACRYGPCSLKKATDILSIQPSTMWFTGNARPDDVIRKIGRRYRLCFSFHSSFSEIRDFLAYIRPHHVYPNVIPYGSSEEEVIQRLQDCLRGSKGGVSQDHVSMATDFQPFGSLKNSSKKRQHGNHTEDDLDQLFECSPVKQKRTDARSRGYIKKDNDGDSSAVRGSERKELEGDQREGHGYDLLPWEHKNSVEENSYSCTFADSDGLLSDSDEENYDIPKMEVGQSVTNMDGGYEGNHLKFNHVDDGRTKADHSSGSDDDGLMKGGKEDEYQEDSQSINPSQSSINDGSIALFSDDSHQGDSQKSGSMSSSNWLQYLPNTQQTPTKGPQSLMESDGDKPETVEDDIHPSCPILISDGEDSDATHICSQRSIQSNGSSVNDIQIISVTPRNPECSSKSRGLFTSGDSLKKTDPGKGNDSRPSENSVLRDGHQLNGRFRQENDTENTSSLESVIEIINSP
ncbi:protein artemis-like [Lytechinus variegatus]|uniref:protein artemis-like n=1 Tax=Lytechinus variegatus TaxID=7654 RepID=UPI001BB20C52|nr:protein artemis-like [Lytechinus variegatus]